MTGAALLRARSIVAVLACTGAAFTGCARVYGPGGIDHVSSPPAMPAARTPAATPTSSEEEEAPVAGATAAATAEAHAADPAAAPSSDAGVDAPRSHPFRDAIPGKLGSTSPAVSIADMSPSECEREVDKRGLPLEHSKKAAAGVTTPMQLSGPLHGVKVLTPGSKSEFGVMDCRLGLALDDLAASLSDFGVVEIHVDNIYRKNAHLPGKKKPSQHAYGLAADITAFELADGRELKPGDDWQADIGEVACGPDAVMKAPSDRSIALRDMVCEVAREGLFHDVLTPSFNAAHRTHFHFDIKHDETHQAVR